MLIDIHSHRLSTDSNIRSFLNLSVTSEKSYSDAPYSSAGIHPWFIEPDNLELQFENLEVILSKNAQLVGECGLDKLQGADFELQEEVFIRQIRLAERFKKPIVVHCVRSFSELLAIKKLIQPKVAMLIHGFNKKPELAIELAQKGFYLSFGNAILTSETAQKALLKTDLNQILFETDDAEIDILQVYKKASEILRLEMEKLEEKIFENYLRLFL